MTGPDGSVLDQFRALAVERLARIEILLARGGGSEAEREIGRELHTLKGEARIVGLGDLAEDTHRAEDALVAHLSARSAESLDRLERALEALAGGLGAGQAAGATDGTVRIPRARIAELTALAAAMRSAEPELDDLRAALEELAAQGARLAHRLRRAAGVTADEAAAWIDRLEQTAGGLAVRARRARGDAVEHRDALEEAARALAMVPLGSLLEPQRAAVRRFAREQDKEIEVVIDGADVEIDADVLERLREPLLHLVRNAIDHGLETPEERALAGKPAAGTLRLEAAPAGNEVTIAVTDDGRGIDAEALRGRAGDVDLGPSPSRDALLRLVFVPGLSTRTEVGATSGRGVGMDVVARRVGELGGRISVASEPGHGTRFELRVPVSSTLGLALVCEAAGHGWALPASAVVALEDAEALAPEPAGQGWVVRLDGAAIPFVPLASLLALDEAGSPRRVVVVETGARRLALAVDLCRGVERVLVRTEPGLLAGLPLLAGVALVEGGAAVPVLDPAALTRVAAEGVRARPSAPSGPRPRALVVDDSAIMRQLAVSLLRSLGHEVMEAADGRDALRRLDTAVPDLIVTDLEMPVMDGFALLERVRADERTRRVPVIVFSSRTGEAMRRAGALGADACVEKSALVRPELERAVRRLLGGPS